MKTKKLATQKNHFGGGNFTRLLCALLITLISLPALATGPWNTKSIHAKAIVVGEGEVYLNKAGEYGGVQHFGTIDENGAYIESPLNTNINDGSRKNPYAQDRQAEMVYSAYGAYAYIAAREKFTVDNNLGTADAGKGFYSAQLFATPAAGSKLKGIYAAKREGVDTVPDYYRPYKICKNALKEESKVEDDEQGKYDENSFAFPDAGGIYPQSTEEPNPAKNINVYPLFSEDGVVDTNGKESDAEHINARSDWKDVNTIFYVVFEKKSEEGWKFYNISEKDVAILGRENVPSELVIPTTVNYDNKTFNVTKIEAGAFGDCSKVKEVFVNSTSIIEISESPFAGLSDNAKLYVPFGKASEYKDTGENKWGRFKEIIETSFDGKVPETVTVGNAFAGVVVDANYEKVPVENVKNYTLIDGTDMVTLQNDFTAENVIYSREMSTTWGSVCLPFALASNDDVKYFELTEVSAEALTFSPVETVAANTPVFFKRLNNNNYTATVANAEVKKLAGAGHPSKEAITGWTAEGVYKAETVKAAEGNVSYFIYGDTFYYTEGNMDMTPFRAYFTVQQANSPQSTLRINEDLHPTDVQEIRENADGTVTVIFDLNGRRLSEPQRGAINIVNGKKVLVK